MNMRTIIIIQRENKTSTEQGQKLGFLLLFHHNYENKSNKTDYNSMEYKITLPNINHETMASTISSLIGEVMITSSDGDYLREVTSKW